MTPNLTAFTGVDSQNLPDVMVSVQFILAIGAVFILKKKIEKVLSFLPAEIEIIRTIDSLKNNSCGKKKQKKEYASLLLLQRSLVNRA
ncbi:hypothetical protein [Lactobacillus delbrueckii]|uniref:hypothetical protein n=1 Tax=Lactobacillus delbrueckii TaxID=1584 RepID=UPI001F34347F|nr:hypothetical protein [Lactobacillus delbrueckii]